MKCDVSKMNNALVSGISRGSARADESVHQRSTSLSISAVTLSKKTESGVAITAFTSRKQWGKSYKTEGDRRWGCGCTPCHQNMQNIR